MRHPRDLTPCAKDPASQHIHAAIPDGGYAYVRDRNGTVHVVPDGPHVHPKILGGGGPALDAGGMTLRRGRVVDLANLSGTFQFDDEGGPLEMAAELKRQGLPVEAGAVLPARRLPACRQAICEPFMAHKIAILEDNLDRQAVMRRCLADRFYTFDARFFDEAGEMIRFLGRHLPETLAISLDNDLEMIPGPDGCLIDPGSGVEVAEYLAGFPAACPVVIHTTNTGAAEAMKAALEAARWQTRRVVPFDDMTWIETDWFFALRRAVVGPIAGHRRGSRS